MMRNNNHIKPKARKEKLFIFISLLLCVFNSSMFSQTETITDTIGIKTDRSILYLTPMEYAFMMHEETSWLFTFDALLENAIVERYYLKVGLEKRIASSLTLKLGIDQSSYESQGEYSEEFGIQTSLEARWYYRLKKRIKENRGAQNMSDNYLAIGFAYTHLFKDKETNYVSLYTKWGLQRRFLKHGHADIGLKVGVGYPINNNYSPFVVFNTFVDIGLAFTKDRYKLDHEKLCPVLKCYDEDKFIIKSNLSSLFSVSLFKYQKRIIIAPHIAFERKIGSSAFSVNTEFQGVFRYFERYIENNQRYYYSSYWRAGLLLEGRWYYNLKRRILKGKTGNSLSANYIALGGSYSYIKNNWNFRYFQPAIHLSTGWQRLFSKHLYFDMNIGLEYRTEIQNNKNNSGDINPRFHIGVGYRF